MLLTIAVLVLATFAVAAVANAAEEPAQAEYVAKLEPICKADTEASHHILAGAQDRVNANKLKGAGRQFGRAATEFQSTIDKLETVPRPPALEVKMTKWFSHLEIVDAYLRKISKALTKEEKLQATYEVVKLRSGANATNNDVFDLGFRYCHLTESHFR
jgi:hypothetical protein